MNVLFIAHYHVIDGSARSLLSLAQGLVRFSVKPYFVVPKRGGLTELLDGLQMPYSVSAVPWWMTKKPVRPELKKELFEDIRAATSNITPLIEQWNINLVYSNTSASPVGRLVSLYECLPHIWHFREYGDIDHSLKFVFPSRLSRLMIESSDAIICHAKAVRDYHFKPGAKRVHQVYNGTATKAHFDEQLDKRGKLPQRSSYTFAMVSSITPKKGQIHAIKAIHALKARGVTARLLLGGDAKPSYLEILEQLVEDLEISHLVQFEGFVADPDDIYFRADCLLVCSDHEALSRAALEATSTAMPVIARNSGGNPEIVTHQVTGLLFDSFDELVESMYEMAITPEKGKKYGLAGWKLARNRFNVEDYAESVHRIIRAVIAEFAVQVSNPSQISHEEII